MQRSVSTCVCGSTRLLDSQQCEPARYVQFRRRHRRLLRARRPEERRARAGGFLGPLVRPLPQYGIRSIPTLMLFKDGQKIETVVGAVPKTTLHTTITKYV